MGKCSLYLGHAFCEGDLSCGLDDWEIREIEPYNKAKAPPNSLSDALVPFIPYKDLESVADNFLNEYYPEALKIPGIGQPPEYVDPNKLASRLGLQVLTHRIREDASVFGQIFFDATDTEMFNPESQKTETVHVDAQTIVVDPENFLLRNLGSLNNTIVHECVHWGIHRKVFLLEKLYNDQASSISCEVVGGARSEIARQATEQMERQANQLAPRIQMPAKPFKAKAKEYITKFMREHGAAHEIDVMEDVIVALSTDFVVSRQAAKIRMVELGFEKAVGTFTYVDDHYVQPHSFKKGAIKRNQTFTIPVQDAAIQRFVNPELRKLTENGDYLFIDNHYVYYAPLYVEYGENGQLQLTGYARSHMDECCLVFDLTITGGAGSDYHTVCYLNRENSDVTFEIKYHNGYENEPPKRQAEMRKRQQEEDLKIRRQMTDDPEQCMKLLMGWRKTTYAQLGVDVDRNPETISRTVRGLTQPETETVVLICIGLHLPPVISTKLLEVMRCPLNPLNPAHQWMDEALHLMYPQSVDQVRAFLSLYDVEI